VTHQNFSVAADPNVEAAIAAKIDTLLEAATHIPGVKAVVLGGSLGRGEATIGPDGLASDIELYLVGSDRRLRDQAQSLEQSQRSAGWDVSIAWVHPRQLTSGRAKNLSWRPSRTIRQYELVTASRVLAGSLPHAMAPAARDIPLAEGVRLILNRLAEASLPIATGSPDADRWLDKTLIAVGDTLLLAAGQYTARYRDRMARLRSLRTPTLTEADKNRVVASYQRKLLGGGSAPSHSDVRRIAAAGLRFGVASTLGMAIAAWDSFPREFAQRAARHEAYLRYLPPAGSSALYESLIVMLRVRWNGLPLRPVALIEALRGRPMSLLAQGTAAPLAFGILEGRADLVEAAARAMYAAGLPSVGGEASDVAATLRRYWAASA